MSYIIVVTLFNSPFIKIHPNNVKFFIIRIFYRDFYSNLVTQK